eukprot:959037-Pleurochrysis_carterae.AAC.1
MQCESIGLMGVRECYVTNPANATGAHTPVPLPPACTRLAPIEPARAPPRLRATDVLSRHKSKHALHYRRNFGDCVHAVESWIKHQKQVRGLVADYVYYAAALKQVNPSGCRKRLLC